MTDRFRLLFSTLTSNSDWRLDTPWTSGSLELPQQRQPTPPAHLALPHHQSGISKSRPPIPQRGQLYFMSRIANGLCMVKSLIHTFLSHFKKTRLQTCTKKVHFILFTTASDEHKCVAFVQHIIKHRCLFLCLIYTH